MTVLSLNSGSSSLKFGLYRVSSGQPDEILSGEAKSIGEGQGEFHAKDREKRTLLRETTTSPSQKDAIVRISGLLSERALPVPEVVGHRIVHGGLRLLRHRIIDETVLRELESATAFAPLHVTAALAVIRSAQDHFPGLPQVACFDTSFHSQMPEVSRVLPIPHALRAVGIHRYGFPGLSCESIVRQLRPGLSSRLIIAHLGNGASITAVKDGKSIDTTMGLTPTGGVIMGTRSGDLDPGILVYLMREKGYDPATLEELVDHQSGLLGLSGISADMRRLHDASASNADAQLAIQMFCYSVRKQIAAMISTLDGVDMIVFTGGIGENDAEARASISPACPGLALTSTPRAAAPLTDAWTILNRDVGCECSHQRKTSRSPSMLPPC